MKDEGMTLGLAIPDPKMHWHCPFECEHPQPFTTSDGKYWCGRCRFKYQVSTEMVLCNPVVCEEWKP